VCIAAVLKLKEAERRLQELKAPDASDVDGLNTGAFSSWSLLSASFNFSTAAMHTFR
jgi:hypothetical protein